MPTVKHSKSTESDRKYTTRPSATQVPHSEQTRSILSTSTVSTAHDSIQYKVSDSNQIEIVDDEDEDEEDSSELTSEKPTIDPSFLELSRKAFYQLNQGQQFIKPESDEDEQLMWLNDQRKRKEDKTEDNELPGKRQVMTLTTVDQLDRNQTCKSDMFQHKIRLAGCKSKTIINRFCHGSCSSFYIPKLRSKKLKATFKSCAACVPVETDHVRVQLDCPDRLEKQMFRTVVRVKRCACRNIQFDDEDEDDS